MNSLSVKLDKVCKQFGKKQALDNVSFDLKDGEILGVLGPNGSGKTTMIRIIMNLLFQDAGEVMVDGLTPDKLNHKLVSYLPEERGLYVKHDIWSFLRYIADLKGIQNIDEEIAHMVSLLDIELPSSGRINTLSKGNQQKLQIGISLLGRPKLVILDEPFSGLDPENRSHIRNILRGLISQGTSVLLATHMLDEAESLCDRVLMLRNGKVVANGHMSEIKKNFSGNNFRVGFLSNVNVLTCEELTEKFIVEKTRSIPPYESVYIVNKKNGEITLSDIVSELTTKGFTPDFVEREYLSLEEIYLKLAGKEN